MRYRFIRGTRYPLGMVSMTTALAILASFPVLAYAIAGYATTTRTTNR